MSHGHLHCIYQERLEQIWWMEKLGAMLVPIISEKVTIPGHTLLFPFQSCETITKAFFIKNDGWLGNLIHENWQLKLSNQNLQHNPSSQTVHQGVLKTLGKEIGVKDTEIQELKTKLANCVAKCLEKEEKLEQVKLEISILKDEIKAFEETIATYREEFTELRSFLNKAEQAKIGQCVCGNSESDKKLEEDVENKCSSLKDAVDAFEKTIDVHLDDSTEIKSSLNNIEHIEQIGRMCCVLDAPVKNCLPYQIKDVHNVLANTFPRANYSFLTEEFYTGTPGYKLQFRVSLCETFLRLDFRVRKGLFDGQVRWPLTAHFKLMVNSDVLDLTERTLAGEIETSGLSMMYVGRPFQQKGNAVYKHDRNIELTKYINYRSDLLFDIVVKTDGTSNDSLE